jgi:hypothetical protein
MLHHFRRDEESYPPEADSPDVAKSIDYTIIHSNLY